MTDLTEVYGAVKKRERRTSISLFDVGSVEVTKLAHCTELRVLDQNGAPTGEIIELFGVSKAPELREEEKVVPLKRNVAEPLRSIVNGLTGPSGGDAA